MSFQRLTLQRFDPSAGGSGSAVGPRIEAAFNPTELTFEKGAQFAEAAIPGLDSPILQFVRNQAESLILELFFDTTDSGTADGATPVTEKTNQIYQLIKIDRTTHAPPVVEVSWGANRLPGWRFSDQWASQSRSKFRCVMENIQQRLTLFSPGGTPLRATLTLRLKEYVPLQRQIEQIRFESPDRVKTRAIQEGETLAGIAAEEYRDPARWREIATHNGITNPLDLRVGQELEIPALR